MKALVKCDPGPGLELVELPTPTVRQDVLVEVKATGICGTDLHIEAGTMGGEDHQDAEDGRARVRR